MSVKPRIPCYSAKHKNPESQIARLAPFCACALLLFSAPALAAEVKEGDEAPRWMLRPMNATASGFKSVSINDLLAGNPVQPKAIIVSFFATYCEPCKKEMPFLQNLYTSYKDKGLVIVEVSIDTEPEAIKEVEKLIADNKVTMPVVNDKMNVVAKRHNVSRLPHIVLIDGEGTVKRILIGYESSQLKVLEADLGVLLGIGRWKNLPTPAKQEKKK
ncbi:MAG: TlpA family protein disulfide reductase [Deltaproteobacteria bacterium]|nr:TlpA family protein disulfide reductase [Deltaproteobacteria bacterium]